MVPLPPAQSFNIIQYHSISSKTRETQNVNVKDWKVLRCPEDLSCLTKKNPPRNSSLGFPAASKLCCGPQSPQSPRLALPPHLRKGGPMPPRSRSVSTGFYGLPWDESSRCSVVSWGIWRILKDVQRIWHFSHFFAICPFLAPLTQQLSLDITSKAFKAQGLAEDAGCSILCAT